jgi:hypothetical protein
LDTPFRKALRPSRAVQLLFNRIEMIVAPVLVYERGDSWAQTVVRVESIVENESAGRAARDPVHPALEAVIEDLARPSRILLTELATRGYISVELVPLADATLRDIKNGNYRRAISGRWGPGSPLTRAAIAGGLHLQRAGIDLDGVHLLGREVHDPLTSVALEAREGKLDLIVPLMGQWGVRQWLFVIRPNRKRPLFAIVARTLDAAALESIGDVHTWLGEHASHISRIG